MWRCCRPCGKPAKKPAAAAATAAAKKPSMPKPAGVKKTKSALKPPKVAADINDDDVDDDDDDDVQLQRLGPKGEGGAWRQGLPMPGAEPLSDPPPTLRLN